MFENHPKSPGPIKAIKVEKELKEFTMKRRDSKLLRSPSPIHHEAWKRVTGVNSRPMTPNSAFRNKDFTADNLSDYSNFNIYGNVPNNYMEKHPVIMSRSNSVISDFDQVKGKHETFSNYSCE
mmetsp:Transcript_16406/g.18962  ORF Transcript_16406/g.18962 Transcript_16406/m.18962 type:complete len:123 (-) Transcript_16406:12-380(-)|eukprot:CAMPEP_0168330646 /NCGR_PEP_ID=MMETSP0213-20121227/7862_1 /TAXON_ID=151035 /ORGANISM="Euplotes harpa, Strain FSP1.4" /LENGTH=122 /DNA_ID=CAMNT_0008334271 /DNA_START=855 /DNA_END=1223 /DNA_ORIENTATION=-